MSKNIWNKFAISYSSYFEQRMFCTAQNMVINFNLTKDNLKILDAGCGSGICSNHILANVKYNAEVNAIDFSKEMIKIAKSRPISNLVKFQEMDTTQLEFPDEYFDIYTSNMVLMILDYPNEMIKEAYRVLKYDQIACFSVWGREENSLGINLAGICFNEVCNKYGLNNLISDRSGRSPFYLNKIEEVTRMFNDNGFNVIKTYYNLNVLETWNLDRYIEYSLYEFNLVNPSYNIFKDENPDFHKEMIDLFKSLTYQEFRDDKNPTLESLVYVVRKDNV